MRLLKDLSSFKSLCQIYCYVCEKSIYMYIPVKNNGATLASKFAENIMCRCFERLTERFV